MRPLIYILLFFLFPTVSIAQSSTNGQGSISAGLNYSLNYGYRNLATEDPNPIMPTIIKARDESEVPLIGFNTGITAYYSLTDRIELELGFQFARQGYMVDDIPLTNVFGTSVYGTADIEYKFHYIEIPIRFNYHFLNNDFFGYVFAGASPNFFLYQENTTTYTYNDGSTEVNENRPEDETINNFVISGIGGVGFGYQVFEVLQVRLEPIFRYGFTPVADTPIEQRNYSLGGQFVVRLLL